MNAWTRTWYRLYRYLRPRRYRQGQLAEQRHQLLDIDPDPRSPHALPLRISGA